MASVGMQQRWEQWEADESTPDRGSPPFLSVLPAMLSRSVSEITSPVKRNLNAYQLLFSGTLITVINISSMANLQGFEMI